MMNSGVNSHQGPEAFRYQQAGSNLLERFLDSLEGSRQDALAAFEAIRALDEVAEDLAARAGAAADEAVAPGVAADPRRLAETRRRGAEARELLLRVADAKHSIAGASYTQLDVAIADLDKRMRVLEALLKAQGATHAQLDDDTGGPLAAGDAGGGDDAGDDGGGGGGSGRKSRNDPVPGGNSRTRRGGVNEAAAASRAALLRERQERAHQFASKLASPLDSRVDTAEPTYCTCAQVAFGEMIECDNPACPIGWYHTVCVGLGRASTAAGGGGSGVAKAGGAGSGASPAGSGGRGAGSSSSSSSAAAASSAGAPAADTGDAWFCPTCTAAKQRGGGGGGGGHGAGGRGAGGR